MTKNEKRATSNKILFLTLYTFGLTGGIEKVCRSLAKALADLNLKFQLFSMYDRTTDIDARYLKAANYNGFGGQKLLFALSAIRKGISSHTIILSHVNLLIFAKLIKTLSPKTRIIMYAHGIEVWEALPNWKRKFLQRNVEIWAVSDYTAHKIITMHQIDKKSIKIVRNCLDPYFNIPNEFEKPTHLLQRYHLQEEQPILFTLTRLSIQEGYKGYDQVLLAMPALIKEYPNLHYLLAGKADIQEEKRIKTRIEQLGLKNHVTLCGFIKDEELTEYFKLGSIFIMPSTHEGFGIVFIEAATCGAKVIAGNVDGSVDALLNGKLGTLVAPQNVEEISWAIMQNLKSEQHPLAIQQTCLAHFSYPNYRSTIHKLIAA